MAAAVWSVMQPVLVIKRASLIVLVLAGAGCASLWPWASGETYIHDPDEIDRETWLLSEEWYAEPLWQPNQADVFKADEALKRCATKFASSNHADARPLRCNRAYWGVTEERGQAIRINGSCCGEDGWQGITVAIHGGNGCWFSALYSIERDSIVSYYSTDDNG